MVKKSLCIFMVIPTVFFSTLMPFQHRFVNLEVSVFNEIQEYNDAPDSLEKTLYKEEVEELETITTDFNLLNIEQILESKNYQDEIIKVDKILSEAQQLFEKKEYISSKILLFLTILGSEGDGIEPNLNATVEQLERATKLVEKCDLLIINQVNSAVKESGSSLFIL